MFFHEPWLNMPIEMSNSIQRLGEQRTYLDSFVDEHLPDVDILFIVVEFVLSNNFEQFLYDNIHLLLFGTSNGHEGLFIIEDRFLHRSSLSLCRVIRYPVTCSQHHHIFGGPIDVVLFIKLHLDALVSMSMIYSTTFRLKYSRWRVNTLKGLIGMSIVGSP